MSSDPVRSEIVRLAKARRRARFVNVLGAAAFWGLLAVVPLAFFTGPDTTLVVAAAVLATALLAAVLLAALVPIDPIAIAKRYDDVAGTKDLLSSSLELAVPSADLGAADARFVAAVHEDARRATGLVGADRLYPLRAPKEAKLLPVPAVAIAAVLLWPVLTVPAVPKPSTAEREAIQAGAQQLLDLLKRRQDDALAEMDLERQKRIQELIDRLMREDTGKRDSLAEIAKLAAQLDQERKDLEQKKLQLEKNATKLTSGEDAKDAKSDMDAGRYREAANKLKKKIQELEKQLDEARKKKMDKLAIEKLQERLAKLRELLAELEQLDAVGQELGYLVEVLEALDRIEGVLGELQLPEGDEFDEVQLGKPRPPGERAEPQEGAELFAFPSNEAGRGHAKKVLGESRRALTQRQEQEAKLREGKGKSAFGQLKTANDKSQSKLAYKDTWLAARQAAEDAVYRQNIPAGYRTYLRRYFEAMQPDERPAATPEPETAPSGGSAEPREGR